VLNALAMEGARLGCEALSQVPCTWVQETHFIKPSSRFEALSVLGALAMEGGETQVRGTFPSALHLGSGAPFHNAL